MDKRRMCPNCRAFITINDRVCPYCEANLGPRAVDTRAAQMANALVPQANLPSVVITIVNVAFFVAMVLVDMKDPRWHLGEDFTIQTLVFFGAKYSPLIAQDGQWWRLITAGFLHGGILHILMNSWAMFDLVGEVQQFYGTARLIVTYVVSTFAGFLLSYLWSASVSSGASAALFGLIGVMLAMGLRRDNPLAQQVRAYYRRWAIYGLIYSFLPFFHIDVAAHIGGLVGGFLVGFLAGLPGLPNTRKETLWRAAAGLALAVVVYAFYQDFRYYQLIQSQIGQ